MAMKSTKELARDLGLLRKRKVCGALPKGKKKSKIDQIFSYLVVLDFESTCWENDKTIPQEIIEFPAVLLNCSSGQIESTFQHYVLPSEKPCLSDFCKRLTGISQDQVDCGIPLSVCLRKFFYWLKKLQTEKDLVYATENQFSNQDGDQSSRKNKLAAFLTWSDWDLGVCLLNETKRKQIMKPSALDRWIDLRVTYRERGEVQEDHIFPCNVAGVMKFKKFYGRRPDGLNGAMKDLGLKFEGREHSGIDDAKNTAWLAFRLMCDGCLFYITKSLKTNVNNTNEQSYKSASSHDTIQNAVQSKHASLLSKSSPRRSPRRAAPKTTSDGRSFVIKEDNVNVTSLTKNNSEFNDKSNSTSTRKGLSVRCDNVFSAKSPPNKTRKTSLGTSTKSDIKSSHTHMKSSTANVSISSSSSLPQSLKSPFVTPKSLHHITRIPVIPASSSNYNKNICASLSPSSSSSKLKTPPTFSSSAAKCKTTPTSSSSISHFKTPHNLTTIWSKTSVTSSWKSSSHLNLSAPFKSPTTSSTFTRSIAPTASNLSMRTPIHPSGISSISSVNVKTPFTHNRPTTRAGMRVTPPLCSCGRRSRRRLVQNPGPNEGRWFFSCTSGNRSYSDKSHSGCGFFQWELSVV